MKTREQERLRGEVRRAVEAVQEARELRFLLAVIRAMPRREVLG